MRELYKSLKKIYSTKEEVKAMLISALEKEKKETFEKGKLEGKTEGKREAARKMLYEGMSIYLISKITGLSEQEILRLKPKL